MAELTDIQKDLQLLAADLKRLEGEYNMFFRAGCRVRRGKRAVGSKRWSSATIAA